MKNRGLCKLYLQHSCCETSSHRTYTLMCVQGPRTAVRAHLPPHRPTTERLWINELAVLAWLPCTLCTLIWTAGFIYITFVRCTCCWIQHTINLIENRFELLTVETLFSNARIPGDFTSSPSTKCVFVFSVSPMLSLVEYSATPLLLQFWCKFNSVYY